MPHGEKKRPPRIPLSPEEVAHLVAMKKRLAAKHMAAFKHSATYRFCNLFNIVCFFLYWELLLCFMGPCHYQTHYSKNMQVKLSYTRNAEGKYKVEEVKIVGVNGDQHKLMVSDYIDRPQRQSAYQIGKDYILRKNLRGILDTSDSSYRLEEASPIIFLSVFLIVISCISFFYNLNEQPHSLRAVTIANALALFAFLSI